LPDTTSGVFPFNDLADNDENRKESIVAVKEVRVMNLGVLITSSGYTLSYPPTNPISSRSPFYSEMVSWNPKSGRVTLTTVLKDDFTKSAPSSSPSSYSPSNAWRFHQAVKDTRVPVNQLRMDSAQTTVSRYSAQTVNPKCEPGLTTQCQAKGTVWTAAK
jgi:hypothetical protein